MRRELFEKYQKGTEHTMFFGTQLMQVGPQRTKLRKSGNGSFDCINKKVNHISELLTLSLEAANYENYFCHRL